MADLKPTTKAAIERYAKNNGLCFRECLKAYSQYWDWVRAKTEEMRYPPGLNDNQFHQLPTGICVEGFGDLYVPFSSYKRPAVQVDYEKMIENIEKHKQKYGSKD